MLALAAIYDGASRTEAAAIGGVTLQIVRDWVLRFNALGLEGLVDRKAPGQKPLLDDKHRAALAAIIESGPIPAVHGVVRWRIIDLCQWVWEEFQVNVSKQTLSRELRAMGYRKLSARPRHHAQAAGAIETFKKSSPPSLEAIARERSIDRRRHRGLVRRRSQDRTEEQDHPSLGQTWHPPLGALTTSEPRRPTSSVPSVPAEGKAVGLILPWCNTEAMNLHLAAISADIAPGRHAALLVDQAGWHLSAPLVVPDNITIVPLPAEMPRTQRAGKRLAVHARQLALQSGVRRLRRAARSLLRGLEQARRSAVGHHVHRIARLGT